MTRIAILILGFTCQYGVVFGASYLLCRWGRRRSGNLDLIRHVRGAVRAFGIFASIFVFLILLISELVAPKALWFVFAAPAWAGGFFVVFDLAVGLAIKRRG